MRHCTGGKGPRPGSCPPQTPAHVARSPRSAGGHTAGRRAGHSAPGRKESRTTGTTPLCPCPETGITKGGGVGSNGRCSSQTQRWSGVGIPPPFSPRSHLRRVHGVPLCSVGQGLPNLCLGCVLDEFRTNLGQGRGRGGGGGAGQPLSRGAHRAVGAPHSDQPSVADRTMSVRPSSSFSLRRARRRRSGDGDAIWGAKGARRGREGNCPCNGQGPGSRDETFL
jgi:hypothetical protein